MPDIYFKEIANVGYSLVAKLNNAFRKIITFTPGKVNVNVKLEAKGDLTANKGTVDLRTSSGRGVAIPTTQASDQFGGTIYYNESDNSLNIYNNTDGGYGKIGQTVDLITMGTHTTGNYVATVSGTTNEIEVSGSGGETASVVIGLPDDVTIAGDATVTGDLTISGNDIKDSGGSAAITFDGSQNTVLAGDLTVNGGDVTITAGQDTDAILLLQSDNSDDAGDDWEILAKQADKKLTIGNDIASAGTYVPHITITPHATISSSIVDVHGSIRIESKLISGELRVGSHTNYIWQDGWHGYREHIFFTPADFSSNAISGGAYANAPNTATNVSDTLDDIRFTSGAPLRPRCNSHPFVTGDRVKFDSVGGTTELNGNTYVVTVSDVNNISLDGTDSDDFSAFTSGGNAVAIRRLANIAHNLAVNDFVQLPSGGGGGDEEFIVVAVSTDEFTVDSDLTNAVSSAQAEYKLSLVYHTAVNGTSALPSYGIMSGTGSTGSVLTGDANADMIAMTVIPKGFMATGAQCWATAGGGGTQPTFKVGYKLIGNDSSKTDSYSSAQTTSLADANISEISFDTAGDDASNNIECVESQGAVHHPRIIIMQFIKENADDELWGGVIFISPMV